jgi:hypothetical protein
LSVLRAGWWGTVSGGSGGGARQAPCWGSEGTTVGCCLGARRGLPLLVWWWVVGWWWVEICIVDASILVFVVRLGVLCVG